MCNMQYCYYEDDITVTCDDCPFFIAWPVEENELDDYYEDFVDFEDDDDEVMGACVPQ